MVSICLEGIQIYTGILKTPYTPIYLHTTFNIFYNCKICQLIPLFVVNDNTTQILPLLMPRL